MYLFSAAVPFGFALTATRLIQNIVSIIRMTEPETVHETDEHAFKK
jgi:TRAP-type C4-dicarboxylate transport system permease small subunit